MINESKRRSADKYIVLSNPKLEEVSDGVSQNRDFLCGRSAHVPCIHLQAARC